MPGRARSIPILASLDIGETRDFYVWQLGFSVRHEMPHYLIVGRDDIELHFWKTDRRELSENTSCYIRGELVPELYSEYSQNRVLRLSTFEVREWNMKEFYILDPHGNLLRFGCEPL